MPPNDFDPADLGDAELAIAPQRTSIMAILSLICALICIIPGMGLLATILGISAAVGISGSRGRVGGMGLAIAGIVLGLLFSMLWVGGFLGMRQVMSMFQSSLMAPLSQVMTAIDNGDTKNARAMFSPAANAAITDEQIKAFRDAYQAELGSFKGIPQGFMEFIMGYKDLGQVLQVYQGRPGFIPTPGTFDKGPAAVVLVLDQSGSGKPPTTPQGSFTIPILNILIIAPGGKTIELIPSGVPMIVPPAKKIPPSTPVTPPPTPESPPPAPGSGG